MEISGGRERISTNRNSPNNRPSNPLLLDEAQGQAVPPGDGRGLALAGVKPALTVVGKSNG